MPRTPSGHTRPWSPQFTFLCLAMLAYSLVCARGGDLEPTLEYQVKAAFLLNFAKFIEWPAAAFSDSQSAMEICVLGKDPFGHALDDLVQGESVNGRKLVVRRLSELPGPQTCQIVFIDPEMKDLKSILAVLGPGMLTVSEGERFLRDGGMITLVIENRRVRFDINRAASEEHGLKLSSRLLSLARSVIR